MKSNQSIQRKYKLEENVDINEKKKSLEGILSKYTNVMKGWQNRYFVVNEEKGLLEYYMPEDKKKVNHMRGCLNLEKCTISPSEDDSQTFTVNSICGEFYKLKASNTKERQKWVDKLRQVGYNLENKKELLMENTQLNDVRESLLNTQKIQLKLVTSIENFVNLDKELLLLKATSFSSVMALEQCFTILQSINDSKL